MKPDEARCWRDEGRRQLSIAWKSRSVPLLTAYHRPVACVYSGHLLRFSDLREHFVPLSTLFSLSRMSVRNVVSPARLPPTFTSLYRLFLRATSASFLHQARSTRQLRRLWRPVFDGAACVLVKSQSEHPGSLERQKLEEWLRTWDSRSTRLFEQSS